MVTVTGILSIPEITAVISNLAIMVVMNLTCGSIYNESLCLEKILQFGSALLSRNDMIFAMLDQAQCKRDVNMAHFLLQQSTIPGSGYDCPHGMALSGNDSFNGHWGMKKLCAYIETICKKFHPTLTWKCWSC